MGRKDLMETWIHLVATTIVAPTPEMIWLLLYDLFSVIFILFLQISFYIAFVSEILYAWSRSPGLQVGALRVP